MLVAANGSDALQIAKTYSDGEIAVMVTDLVMPLMGGRELANQITAAHPNIKIIFTSGYSDDETIQQEMSSNDVTFPKSHLRPLSWLELLGPRWINKRPTLIVLHALGLESC